MVWFNFQDVYLIFSINLVSQVTLRSSGTDILHGCHLLRRLYDINYKLPSDRLNNHSRSRELIKFVYDVADL